MLRPIPFFISSLFLFSSLVTATGGGGGDGGPGCSANPPDDKSKCWKDVMKLGWTVHGFDYHASYIFTTPAHQNSYGYVNFNLTNNMAPYTATCSATSGQLQDFFYGTQWYPCALPSTAPAGAAASFRFNRPTGQLDLNETIICGEDDKKTKTFYASGSTNLTLSCTDTTTVTPNWTLGSGQFYSDREVKCTPVDATVRAAQIVA